MKLNFQLILIIIFVVAAIFGVLVFSGAIPIGTSNEPGGLGTVVLWGTVPTPSISSALADFNAANPAFVVSYVQKSAETFDHDLLEALASGTGPDLFFLPDDLAYHYANKIFTIPYQSYPPSVFKTTFAGAGEVFLTSGGTLAFPVAIDPLVMYYNRSMFDATGIVYPPATWDDLALDAPKLTQKDDSNKIIKSGVALGQFSNITHAKDILTTLFMQAGNPIIKEENGSYVSALDVAGGAYSLSSMLLFYTDFADPNNAVYSWNRSFAGSSDVFSANNLGIYFGYASELQTLVNKNPNQNFFVAEMPQIKGASLKLTESRVTGLAVSSFSQNLNTALSAASLLAEGDFAAKFAAAIGAVPARRDLLNVQPVDSYSPVFYRSALYAESFLDPSSSDTDAIFSTMTNAVLSNTMTADQAVKDAGAKLQLLLLK